MRVSESAGLRVLCLECGHGVFYGFSGSLVVARCTCEFPDQNPNSSVSVLGLLRKASALYIVDWS